MSENERSSFGQVYEKQGRWHAKFPCGKTPAGRTAYRVRRVSSEEKGRRFLAEVRKAQLSGTFRETPVASSRVTVAQAVREYIEAKKAQGRATGTLQQYRISLKAFEASRLGSIAVDKVTPQDVETFLAWRRRHVWSTRVGKGGTVLVEFAKDERASNAVLYRDRGLLSAVFRRLVKYRQLPHNPVELVDPPKRRQTIRRPFEKEEIRQLLAACDADHLRPLVQAGLYTGQGALELIRWRWRDLSFSRKSISVLRQKTGKVIEVPMHADLAEELQRLRERRTTRTGRIPSADEHVFLSRYGRPYAQFPKGAWETAIRRAGLSGRCLTPHSLRRTFATYFPGTDVDCQRLLGHAELKTTLIYRRSRDERTRESVNALDYGLKHTPSTPAAGSGG